METARALTENLAALLRREHDALADFLVALAEFDKRRLWVELGHSSLFYFLHRELRLSLGAAQHRKVAAELIQLVPRWSSRSGAASCASPASLRWPRC